jgi:hypothetical protein
MKNKKAIEEEIEFGEMIRYKKTRGMTTGIFLGKVKNTDLAWVLQREIESRDWTTVQQDFRSKLILVNYSELKKHFK